MAKINPYNIDLPNRVVGTPGVDQSAGQAAQSFSQGLIQVRNDDAALTNSYSSLGNAYASLATQKGNLFGGLLGSVGQAIGHEAQKRIQLKKQNAQNVQKVQQQIADAKLVSDGHDFAQDAQSTLDDYQQKYIDTPDQIPIQMQDFLTRQKKSRLQKYSDPVMSARAEANFDGTIESVMNKASGKSLDMQHAQAVAVVPNMVTQAKNSIAQQTGPIDDRNKNFAAQAQIMSDGIRGMQPLLGKVATEKLLDTAGSQLASEFMSNLINERPDNPIDALQHLTLVGRTLKGIAIMNAALPGNKYLLSDDDKRKYDGQLNAATNAELKDLKSTLQSYHSDFSAKLGVQRVDLDLNHEDPVRQQQALDWAKNYSQGVQGKIQQINNDPKLPEEAKDTMRQDQLDQLKEVDQLVRVAHANQQYQLSLQRAAEAEKRHDAVEARRIQHEAKQELRAQQQKQKEEARAQLKMNKWEAEIAINGKLDDFQRYAVEPAKNRDKLISLQAEINFLAKNGRDAGYLDPDWAQSHLEKVNKIGLAAAQYKERPQFGFFGPSKIMKIKNQDEQAKAKADLEAEVAKGLSSLRNSRKADARFELMRAYISPEGKKIYQDYADQIQASKLLSPTVKVLRTNQLLSQVLFDYPAKKGSHLPAPPSAKQLSSAGEPHTMNIGSAPARKGFVNPPTAGAILTSSAPEGYNGNIDITRRQLVLHLGGKLTPENSTEAARKEMGGKADGDYGTEFSIRFTDGSHEVSVPTIFDGKVHSQAEAVAHYHKTGQYLGKWPVGTSEKVMDEYEDRVHSREQKLNGIAYRGPHG